MSDEGISPSGDPSMMKLMAEHYVVEFLHSQPHFLCESWAHEIVGST